MIWTKRLNGFLVRLIETWLIFRLKIDPMQKWLPLNYSFVRFQNSLTNLVRDNKFLIYNFCLKNEVSEAISNTNKTII